MGLSTSIVLFLYSPSINSFKGANFKKISLVTIMMVLTHLSEWFEENYNEKAGKGCSSATQLDCSFAEERGARDLIHPLQTASSENAHN